MSLKAFFKKNLLGYTIPQEYLCLDREALEHPLRVFLSAGTTSEFFEVTHRHVFLGYKPLVFGFFDMPEWSSRSSVLCLSFTTGDFSERRQWRGHAVCSRSIATMIIKTHSTIKINGEHLYLYTGQHGSHIFLNKINQWINRLSESGKALKAGNVYLPGNLYEQVRIAYAIPRQISIITVGHESSFNMFPTDLHGAMNTIYAGSLRHGGKACAQVEREKKICLSSVDPAWHLRAYQLGKNHMQDLHPLPAQDVSTIHSAILHLPLPATVLAYREMEILEHIDIGIHRIFFYRVLHAATVHQHALPLTHVHRYLAQWRNRQGWKTSYMLR